jgi:hypothetical protein
MDTNKPFLGDIIRHGSDQDWLIISFVLLAIAYVAVRLVYGRYWKRYRQAILYGMEAQKLTHEKNVLLLQAAISLNILAVLSIGLFIFIFLDYFKWIAFLPENFPGWVFTTSGVIVVVLVKYTINHILGFSANQVSVTSQINHQWLINLKNFGFFILPVSIVSAFVIAPFKNIALYLGIAVIVFMLVMNYVKGFMVLLQNRISIYYGILYLCTLEILPFLIVWKVISM